MEMEGDRNVVLAAVVAQGGYRALQLASGGLREDKEVVLAAVAQDGAALEFASAGLQGDVGVVRAAVEADWEALRFATADVRGDYYVGMLAVGFDSGAVYYLDFALRERAEVVVKAALTDIIHEVRGPGVREHVRSDVVAILDVVPSLVGLKLNPELRQGDPMNCWWSAVEEFKAIRWYVEEEGWGAGEAAAEVKARQSASLTLLESGGGSGSWELATPKWWGSCDFVSLARWAGVSSLRAISVVDSRGRELTVWGALTGRQGYVVWGDEVSGDVSVDDDSSDESVDSQGYPFDHDRPSRNVFGP